MLDTPFSPWPSYTAEEVNAVAEVLASNRVNYWTGEEGRGFEREFARWCYSEHAIALANGTLALDLVLHGLRIGAANGGTAHDEVIVTPRTFVASVSCVVNAGAVPVFADVDRDSGNLTAETIAPRVTGQTRAIIVVHLGGWPADVAVLRELADPRSIHIIEDCAQAHGARWEGQPVGSLGIAGAWSFCQDKIMTTGGEGGMVTCNDRDLWSRMWSFKDHGKSWEVVNDQSHPPGYRWLHESFGTNWRMTELQAVLGRIQLKRMDGWHNRRRHNAFAIAEHLQPLVERGVVRLPLPDDRAQGTQGAYYRLYAYINQSALSGGWSRDRIIAEFNVRGAVVMSGSASEVYRERAFDGTGWRPVAPLPIARELGETSLAFLVHPTLRDDELAKIGSIVAEVIAESAR